MAVHIPARTATLTREKRRHTVDLNKIVPKEHDVVAFAIGSLPDGLEAVHIRIGGMPVLRFDAHELEADAPVPLHIRVSMCTYHVVSLVFEFSEAYIESHGDGDPVLEKVTEYSDTEEDFYCEATGGVETGRRVHYSWRDTGMRYACVTVPHVTLDVKKVGQEAPSSVRDDLWQTLGVAPDKYTPEYLRRLAVRHGLHAADGTPLDDILRSDDTYEPFEARIRNTIVYSDGMAGVCHSF